MEKLHIERKAEPIEFAYDIIWEKDFSLLKEAVSSLQLSAKNVCIVTDSNVAPLYLSQVSSILSKIFEHVISYVIPAGEAHKNLFEIQNIYQCLLENHFERKDILLALGGGVVGDMTGFTAATYRRGIDFLQIPTTLLSQVDSSIGGKTGVDFDSYKNMIGAFHQPRLVYMNMSVLQTLPDDQFASGIGEVLKSALIRNAELYDWIDTNRKEIKSRDAASLIHLIRACCVIKGAVVEEDPKEFGVRAILNFGHTIGHAVEKLMDFRLLHGACVGLGTIAAARLSMIRGYISQTDFEKIAELNEYFDLPEQVKGIDAKAIFNATKSDKKMEGGRVKFILLHAIGNAYVDKTVTDIELLDIIKTVITE